MWRPEANRLVAFAQYCAGKCLYRRRTIQEHCTQNGILMGQSRTRIGLSQINSRTVRDVKLAVHSTERWSQAASFRFYARKHSSVRPHQSNPRGAVLLPLPREIKSLRSAAAFLAPHLRFLREGVECKAGIFDRRQEIELRRPAVLPCQCGVVFFVRS